MQRAQADAFIRRVTWLVETPVAFRDQLLARCDVQRLRKAETLYNVGDAATGLYGVVEGYVEVHIPDRGVKSTLSYMSADRGVGWAISPP
jgi:CRP-like cAMP-binding protein